MTPTPYYRGARKPGTLYRVSDPKLHREHEVATLSAALALALDWASRHSTIGVVDVYFVDELVAQAHGNGRGASAWARFPEEVVS